MRDNVKKYFQRCEILALAKKLNQQEQQQNDFQNLFRQVTILHGMENLKKHSTKCHQLQLHYQIVRKRKYTSPQAHLFNLSMCVFVLNNENYLFDHQCVYLEMIQATMCVSYREILSLSFLEYVFKISSFALGDIERFRTLSNAHTSIANYNLHTYKHIAEIWSTNKCLDVCRNSERSLFCHSFLEIILYSTIKEKLVNLRR